MSERLKDLLRQRALAEEQLAALDREIAREKRATPAPPPTTPVAATITPSITPAATGPDSGVDAEAMLAEYRSDPEALNRNVKRGCLLYFFAASGLFALGLLAFYLLHRHP